MQESGDLLGLGSALTKAAVEEGGELRNNVVLEALRRVHHLAIAHVLRLILPYAYHY